MLILVLVLKDSLRTKFKSLSLSLPVQSLLTSLSLALYFHLIHRRIYRPHWESWFSPPPVCGWRRSRALVTSPESAVQLQSTLSSCLVSVGLDAKKSSTYTRKTKIMWSTTPRYKHGLLSAIRVGVNHLMPSTKVHDLGIFISNDVTMRSHVTKTVSGVLLRYDSSTPSDVHYPTPCSSRWSSRRTWRFWAFNFQRQRVTERRCWKSESTPGKDCLVNGWASSGIWRI